MNKNSQEDPDNVAGIIGLVIFFAICAGWIGAATIAIHFAIKYW